MIDYQTYLMRHGEAWIQNIVETIEKREGLHVSHCHPLELRWERLMTFSAVPQALAA